MPLKISTGEWMQDDNEKGISISIYTTERPESIITVWGTTNREDDLTAEESEANAELVLDAAKTANECGLLPSELLQALKDTRTKLMDAFGLFGGGHKLNEIFDFLNKKIENNEHQK